MGSVPLQPGPGEGRCGRSGAEGHEAQEIRLLAVEVSPAGALVWPAGDTRARSAPPARCFSKESTKNPSTFFAQIHCGTTGSKETKENSPLSRSGHRAWRFTLVASVGKDAFLAPSVAAPMGDAGTEWRPSHQRAARR